MEANAVKLAGSDPVKTYVTAVLKVGSALQPFRWSTRKQRLTDRERIAVEAAEEAARALEGNPALAAEARRTAAARLTLTAHDLAMAAEELGRAKVEHGDRALRLLEPLYFEHAWIARAVYLMPTDAASAAETLNEIAKDTARPPSARIHAAWWLTKLTTPGRTLLFDIFQAAFEARDWTTAMSALKAIEELLNLRRSLNDRAEELRILGWEHFGGAMPSKVLIVKGAPDEREPETDWSDELERTLFDTPGSQLAYAASERRRARREAAERLDAEREGYYRRAG